MCCYFSAGSLNLLFLESPWEMKCWEGQCFAFFVLCFVQGLALRVTSPGHVKSHIDLHLMLTEHTGLGNASIGISLLEKGSMPPSEEPLTLGISGWGL